MVIDLGGGSCEFVVERRPAYSAEFGAARLTERWLHHDPPRPEELSACLSVDRDPPRGRAPGAGRPSARRRPGWAWAARSRRSPPSRSASSPTTGTGVNGFVLSRAAAEDVYRTLVTEPLADRVHNPGLPPERAEVILGGACAVVAIMRFFALERDGRSPTADLLDGVVAGLVGAD